ncbi:MAG: pilus assembly protein PilM [Candidatus Thioglobus sp.]|jgi:type IV pilus assembly protein PilN|nr:pilus assembly protein PilM [Candidatus Thioglobus sp.]MBT6967125.1 pilus assembly protein PilM [Candidatus Thioglobus sp.]
MNQTKIINAFLDLLSKYSRADEEILGVDMSPGYIRVARLELKDEKWSILNLIERPIETDLNTTLIDQSNVYTDALKDILEKEKIKTKNVAISIPVSNAIIKVIEMPSMTDNEIQSAIEYESLWENIVRISEDLSQYTIFHQVIKRHVKTNKMDLLFVASKVSDINAYNKIINNAGLETIIIDVKCFATRNAFDIGVQKNSKTQSEAIAIVEFGSVENYLLVIKDNSPHITDIFVKDSDTRDLERGSFSDEELDGFFGRYTMQVKQILSDYESKYSSGRIKTLYVVSDMVNIRNYLELLSNALSDLNIIFYDPFAQVSISGKEKDVIKKHKNKSVFTAAIGLASRSLDIFGYYKYTTGVKNINLLPDRSKIKKKKQANVLLRLLIIVILTLSVGIGGIQYLVLSSEKNTLLKRVAPYAKLRADLDTKQARLAKSIAEKKRMDKNLKFGQKVTTNQVQLRDFYNDMGAAIPKSTWLDSVEYKTDNSVDIVGYAISDESILSYISALSKSDEVEDVTLKTMELKTFDDETVEKRYEIKAFKLVAKLKPPRRKNKSNEEGAK